MQSFRAKQEEVKRPQPTQKSYVHTYISLNPCKLSLFSILTYRFY